MDGIVRSGRAGSARRPALHLALVVCLGAGVGAFIADAPGVFTLCAGLAAVLTVLVADYPTGFLLAGVLMLVQTPVEKLLGLSPDLESVQHYARYADDVLIVILLAGAAWQAARGIGRNRVLFPVALAFLLALAMGAVGAWLHESPPRAAVLDTFSFSKWFLVLFAAFQIRVRAEKLLPLLRAATFVAVGLAVFGYIDILFPALTHDVLPLAGPMAYRMGFRCLVSIFPNEGFSGWFFAAAACIPLAGYIVLRRPADLALASFLALTSFLSYRRKPVIGLAFALATVLLCQTNVTRRRRVLLSAALIVILLLPLLGPVMSDVFRESYAQYIAPPDPMKVARNALYIVSWQIGRDYFPLGAGLGLFGGHASMIDYSEFYGKYGLDRVWGLAASSGHAPNFVTDVFFPHVLGALGLVGALFYAFALLFPARAMVRFARRTRRPATSIVVVAALLVFFEALAESLASPLYEVSLSCYVVFGLAGIALSSAAWEDEFPARTPV